MGLFAQQIKDWWVPAERERATTSKRAAHSFSVCRRVDGRTQSRGKDDDVLPFGEKLEIFGGLLLVQSCRPTPHIYLLAPILTFALSRTAG